MSQYQSYITSSILPSIHPDQNFFPFVSTSFPLSLKTKLTGSVAIGVGFNSGSNFTGETLNRVLFSSFISPNTPTTDKIRIIEQQTNGDILSPFIRTEKQNIIDLNLDTNQLNIVFSQTNQINKDIISQIGPYFSLDEYIGSPALQYESSHIFLNNIKSHYLSKYISKNKTLGTNAFLKLLEDFDTSVIETTEKIIPARTNTTFGAHIESHILDRSKNQRFEPTLENNTYIDGGTDVSAKFSEFAISGDVFSGGNIAGTVYTSPEADKAFDSKNKTFNFLDNSNSNLNLFAPSDTGYVDVEGNKANYDPGLTLSTKTIYERSTYDINDPNITSVSPGSTLVYIFDSLLPTRIPIIKLADLGPGPDFNQNQLRLYFVSSSGGDDMLDSNLYPINSERTVNKISIKTLSYEDLGYNDIKLVLTSSYFNIDDGAEISISGSYFQPNMGTFGLGKIPNLGTPVIIDEGNSITGWITSSNLSEQPYISLTTDNNFPWPSSSTSHINYNISNFAYYGGFPLHKNYPISSSGKHEVSFFVVSSINQTGNLLVEIRQNNQTQNSTTIPFSSIYYNTGIKQNIIFDSISSSFELRFSHFGTGADVNYQIDSISTASYGIGYNAPYFKVRIVSGSYNGIYDNSNLTEILSTGELKAETFASFIKHIDISKRILGSSFNNSFIEIEFYISKSLTGNVTSLDVYNNNPISLNNLEINIGGIEEKYAFKIDKIININSDDIEGSEIILNEDSYFTNYLDNEITPDFNFSIHSFENNTPNRLKPFYNVFTSSFGNNKGQVERGNLQGRNYIPINLTFGSSETDDLPDFYTFNKGILIPINVKNSFNAIKPSIIRFVQNEIENSR